MNWFETFSSKKRIVPIKFNINDRVKLNMGFDRNAMGYVLARVSDSYLFAYDDRKNYVKWVRSHEMDLIKNLKEHV